jgi:hypothetical protein
VDERADKLRKRLTPAGKHFLGRLDKALAEELDRLNNAGGDAIRAEIARHHMRTPDSVKSMNRLGENGTKARLTCHYMIMNYATMLLATDGQYRHGGRPGPVGEQLLEIWRIHANKLVDTGAVPQDQIDAEEAKLLAAVRKAERGGGSLLGRIKALFSR